VTAGGRHLCVPQACSGIDGPAKSSQIPCGSFKINRLFAKSSILNSGESSMIDLVIEEAKDTMGKSVSSLKNELKRVRTGRASLSLLDGIKVDYYGTSTPLNQIASLAVPESRLMTIQPWDASVIKDIEKAILKSDLGLTPNNDGKIVRIAIPPLTEERRKSLVKVIHKMSEEHKVAIRNIRREANEQLKTMKKDGDISEDEAFKAQEKIQKMTDDFIKMIDGVYAEKEKEILEF
jgi:ribosome recycling factor